MSITEDNLGGFRNLTAEARKSGGPDYRVFFVTPDGSVCWANVSASSHMEACKKVDNVLGHRGVIGSDEYEPGEIGVPDLR